MYYRAFVKLFFTPQPEGHTREGVDEWPSGGIPLHGRDRDPALKDAMAVRPWSFTAAGFCRAIRAHATRRHAPP